jgi:hypothetical protein
MKAMADSTLKEIAYDLTVGRPSRNGGLGLMSRENCPFITTPRPVRNGM